MKYRLNLFDLTGQKISRCAPVSTAASSRWNSTGNGRLVMGKLRIGIIGCGSIARVKHVRALLQFPDRCEITALADMQPAAAYSLREDLLPGAKVCED